MHHFHMCTLQFILCIYTTLFEFYRLRLTLIHRCTDTHRHIPNTHTHTHTEAILHCDLQNMQAGIQLPPCQWPIQPSGCTSLRSSLHSLSSLYSITSSTSGALSSIKRSSYPQCCEAQLFNSWRILYKISNCSEQWLSLLIHQIKSEHEANIRF